MATVYWKYSWNVDQDQDQEQNVPSIILQDNGQENASRLSDIVRHQTKLSKFDRIISKPFPTEMVCPPLEGSGGKGLTLSPFYRTDEPPGIF